MVLLGCDVIVYNIVEEGGQVEEAFQAITGEGRSTDRRETEEAVGRGWKMGLGGLGGWGGVGWRGLDGLMSWGGWGQGELGG